MSRPRKWRKICCMPQTNAFSPIGKCRFDEPVTMSVDEYEIIRLMDMEGLNQDESATRIGVARSTVQRIYNNARKKLADFLINGKTLRIEGGDYRLCEAGGQEQSECKWHCCRRGQNNSDTYPNKSGESYENKS